MWWHMILKMTELIETFFFVLRKKFSQVSPLHVYHHVSTFIIAWICAKYVAGNISLVLIRSRHFTIMSFLGGMFTFTVIINSFIHIIMYGYYFLASLGVWQKGLQKFKPVLTTAQMVSYLISVSKNDKATKQMFFRFNCVLYLFTVFKYYYQAARHQRLLHLSIYLT